MTANNAENSATVTDSASDTDGSEERSAEISAPIDAVAALRERLVTMREDLVGRLVARLDGGEMALLGSVGAAIAAVDAMRCEAERQ